MACHAEIDDWINEIKLLPGLHVFTLSTLLTRTQTQEFPPPPAFYSLSVHYKLYMQAQPEALSHRLF